MPEHELPPGLNMPPAGGPEAPTKFAPTTYQSFLGSTAAPATSLNFDGVGQGFSGPQGSFTVSSAPPDTNGDVGLNYYIQWVNTSFAIFNKSDGSVAYGPAAGNTLWQNLGAGNECADDNDGDPIVQYDQMAHRWIMTQFAVSQTDGTSYHQCIAVSKTSDPVNGGWYLYDYSFTNFNDYPKMGVWPDGYYITYNMFSGNSFAGGEVCAYDRAAMLAGNATAAAQCFGPYSSYGGLLPADMDGPDQPPSGSSEYVIAKGGNGASLLFWKLHIDWTTPANSTFTGPTTLAVASFSEACNGGTCIPQLGTATQLDSLGDRLMYRLAYRNFPGDHESLLVNHSITGATASSAIRWYEIRNPSGTPTVYQSGTYDPDGTSRWMGSIAMDRDGDLALGYSASSSAMNPSIWYTGRLAGDPLGTLTQTESTIINGTGSQTTYGANNTALTRWGDYSSMSVDPSDDCTFWYTQEYLTQDGTFNWHTRIAAFKYANCCTVAVPTGLAATVPGNNAIQLSWSAVSGATEYRIYRSTTSGGPYTQIGTAATTSYLDNTVSGGTTYYYTVTAYDTCESLKSTEVSATATGACDAAPTFAGLQSVTSPQSSGCSLDLSWNAATANCGGPVTYSVYRSTTSGFTPALSNRIASGLSGTTYTDSAGLSSGTTYYYIVRATDQSNGQEDANTVEKSGSPIGPNVDGTWSAGAETGDPAMYTNGSWSISTARVRSGTSSYFSGYSNNLCAYLRTPQIALTAGQASALTYWTAWDIENSYDGGVVEISTDGGTTWSTLTPTVGYPGSFNATSTNACNYGNKQPSYTGTGNLTFTSYTVDLSAYNGQNVMIRWNFSTDGSVTYEGWYVDDISITHAQVPGACGSTPSDVFELTARSTSGQAKLEWVNPAAPYGSTRICRATGSYPTDPTACTVVADKAGTAGAYDTYTDTGLANGTKYYYTAFVNDGSGVYSGGKNIWARPFATTGKTKWAYSTGATALAPTGVYPGAIGAGGTWAVSNDRMLHAMNPTSTGGDWPRTAPYSWKPAAMNGPAASRPPVVPTASVPGASMVIFLGSEDGHAYAVNAETGATLWQSPLLGNILVASPSGMFTDFGGSWNLIFVGTRDATADNTMYALDAATGAVKYSFNNGGGAGGIGIISSAATVDYANNRIYFASRSRSGGSADTLRCLGFDGTGFTKLWSAAVGDIDGAPVVLGGRLYVGNNSGTVYAIDAATGATIWSYATTDGAVKGYIWPQYTAGTPSPAAPRKLYFSTTNTVWGINDTGSSATAGWSVTTIPGPSAPLAPFRDTRVYVGSTNGSLYQIDAATGAVTTSVVLGDGTAAVGSPALDVVNNMAYVGSESGAVYAVQLPLQ